MIIQKAIAASGYCSRRKAESFVRDGEVEVNGLEAMVGQIVNPDKDEIKVNGKVIGALEDFVYVKLNKPVDYVCTAAKFKNEKSIFDLVDVKERLFPVGRLDKDSRGLVLLTNDGDLTQKLAHPRFEHDKIYEVRLRDEGPIDGFKLARALEKGVDLGGEDGVVRAKKAEYLQKNDFAITLNEGKKRQIRRMFAALGFYVIDLKRTEISGLRLGNLAEGYWDYLSDAELDRFRKILR